MLGLEVDTSLHQVSGAIVVQSVVFSLSISSFMMSSKIVVISSALSMRVLLPCVAASMWSSAMEVLDDCSSDF